MTAATAPRRRVLFVDDATDLLDGLRNGLRSERRAWQMRFASGGEAALEAMEAEPAEHARKLVLRVEAAGDRVRIRVVDTGPGAGDEALARMFQTFHTTKTRGTGLGLLVTRSLVEAHGGRLEVARNAGRGLTFTIHLPGESR